MTSQDETTDRGSGQQAVAAPAISLPKGGGAIRGIGEKFAANPATGTGSMSVPIATSPGRSGFGPQLSLSYNSGAGNGVFGFGWTLSTPMITRKTDQGLPEYRDHEESDAFALSGAGDLVLLLNSDGSRFVDTTTTPSHTIQRYRPRIEGLFARIERWTNNIDGDVHWRSISKDNILTIYGKDHRSRIAEGSAGHPARIFSWLICETRDDKGNAIVYDYKPEDGTGVDLSRAHERNRGDRDDTRRSANRYLKHIYYGNRVPLLDDSGQRPRSLTPAQIQNAGWMFEVVLDYGEHDAQAPTPHDSGDWTYRSDPFSSYRAGFEVRTGRLCRRVLLFHHFDGEPDVGNDCLVRSTDLTHSAVRDPADACNPVYTFLQAVTQSGYRRRNDGYLRRSLPPVEFEYSQPVVQDAVRYVDPESLENLPTGVDGAVYQWTDLHGEGIPGILTEQAGAWFYKRNISPIGNRPVEFTPMERVAEKPNLSLAGRQAQFMDLAGDGRPDLVVLEGPMAGLYEHDDHEGWGPFRPFNARVNRRVGDPNVRLIDVNGDGHADMLMSEDGAFVWYPSLEENGFGQEGRVPQALDEDKGPRLFFADGTQSIYLADVSGDGLTDLVRIRNGDVSYWPNLGYARFGAKITMDNSPVFDHPDQFDHSRLRLADIDGSGTTDLIYLHRDGARLYFNQSGNNWSAPQSLRAFPHVDDLTMIDLADLFGNGTACLVWSSPLSADARQPMRYVELMGGTKPHLLIKMVNNLGAETCLEYAPSTKFYLQDKYAGRPWITRLPFPVHVVERVVTHDAISGNRFVTRYAYHHGHFDGEEREFRGFGMVEQWDTEEFAALTAGRVLPEATNLDAAMHVPPVLTKTWFHTGVNLGRDHVSDYFAGLPDARYTGEYYLEPGLTDAQARSLLLPDTLLPTGLTLREEGEACRALTGAMLRQEVYALDDTNKSEIPYTVAEQNFTVECLQRRGVNAHAVFFTHGRETINYHYDRNPADPRIAHTLTLDVDLYGNVLKELTIGYGRRVAAADSTLTAYDTAIQSRLLIAYAENSFTNAVLLADHYRAPLVADMRRYELIGFRPESDSGRFDYDQWSRNGFSLLGSAAEIPYHQTADGSTQQKRLIEQIRTLYRKDDLTALSPLGVIEPLALPGQSYKMALTPGLIAQVFKRIQAGQLDDELLPDPAPLLEGRGGDQGGYVAIDRNWWIPSGRAYFHPEANETNHASTAALELNTARQHFYLPRKVTDPFGYGTVVEYDALDLLVTRTCDALSNTVAAANDYRVLQPRVVTDPNRNRTAAAFDALGMVAATAIMGKEGEALGDLLEDIDTDPPLADLQAFIADPQARAITMLGKATTRIVYDLGRYRRADQPPVAATLARETHFHDPAETQTKVQISFSYSDGFTREIQKKIQAEAGATPQRRAHVPLPTGDILAGDLVRDTRGDLVESNASRRWVGSGRTVFNNKGKQVRQYAPFFSATHLYESEREMTDTGVSPMLFYDPIERVVAILHPNYTYEKFVFDPWRQTSYDVNDTVAASGTQTGDPRTDPDIAGYVRGYFMTQPATWQTWRAQRIGGQLGATERSAAEKAAAHADTPTAAHLDALGRPFVTIAHNRFERSGAVIEEYNATRVELDLANNQRAVRDAMNRVVMRYDHDLLGNRIHQASMEAGERWRLSDTGGNPIRAWDSRRFRRRMTYDELRRPTGMYVTEGTAERLAERTVYGEGLGDGANHRTRVHQLFDSAGIVTSGVYDFKGNLCESRRDLLPTYREAVDWQHNPAANDGTFTTLTTYDALNRPLIATAPDGSVYRPTFNEANLLEKMDVNLRGMAVATPFVTNINYDAKGQRARIVYGNGAVTTYEYDPLTLRLRDLRTIRSSPDAAASQLFRNATTVQDLHYSYDPIGNVTQIEDAALKSAVYNGQRIDPVGRYTYDALYRLTEAQGREHIGQTAFNFNTSNGNYRDYPFAGLSAHPNDLQALRNYTERYEYDAVGNFDVLRHFAKGGSWSRRHDRGEVSLIEAAKQNNRLSRTIVGNGVNHVETYSHDANGNMTSAMPQIARMVWDCKDQLQQVDMGEGGTAYYIYDARGQRIRKVVDSRDGTRQRERIYLGRYEIYRSYSGNGANVTVERESLHVMDDRQRIVLIETETVANGNPVNDLVSVHRYQLSDHLSSGGMELAADGTMIAHEEFHPYGTTSLQTGHSVAEVSLRRYRHSGKERDEESGFTYHGARYRASWLGIWISADPSGLVDGPNLFRYARNNPITLKDDSGTQPRPFDISQISVDEKDTDLFAPYSAGNFDFKYSGGNEATVTFRAFVDFSRAEFTPAEKQLFVSRLERAVDSWDRAAIIRITDRRGASSVDVDLRFKLQLVATNDEANKKVDVHPQGDRAVWFNPFHGRETVVMDANLFIGSDQKTITHELGHVYGLEDEYRTNWFEEVFSPGHSSNFFEALVHWKTDAERDEDSLMNVGSSFRARFFSHFKARLAIAFESRLLSVDSEIILNKTTTTSSPQRPTSGTQKINFLQADPPPPPKDRLCTFC